MRVKVNISDFSIKGILLIKYKDRKWKLVAYILKLLFLIRILYYQNINSLYHKNAVIYKVLYTNTYSISTTKYNL